VYAYAVTATGKIMFGWFVSKHFHPAAGLGAAALGMYQPSLFHVSLLICKTAAASGTGVIMVSSTSYQTECMPTSTAALIALSSLLRNIGAAIAAAIMDSILTAMGYGWCFTGLAILDVMCIAGLLFTRVRGRAYREKLATATR
jgi:hypothetical protein